MSELLALLAPPCVGALIGYVTNKVAIRMLFRPLRPWHLCGWSLPFTPGIIPAKRHALALRIGEMVGARLLTAESISRGSSAKRIRSGSGSAWTAAAFRFSEFRSRASRRRSGIWPRRIGFATVRWRKRLRVSFRECISTRT